MTPALQVRSATVRYGEVLALDDVTLTVERGDICALIGMNGSGKSTLFKTIMGVIAPDAGTVTIDGMTPAVARRSGAVAYVPQAEDIDWTFPLSVREVVMMGRYGRQGFLRRPRPADRAAVDEALARVDLDDLQHRQIGNLSGGQRKRAFVARALAQEAGVLLLDEPFAGVDLRSQAAITALLRDEATSGSTVLISTHDLQSVPQLADQAVLLQNRVLAQGQPDEVMTPSSLIRIFGLDPLGDGSR
ncbi:MAG: metal ABC transporter ATP-binding protein [Gordonia sp. (in: high G+C Gram-positive bacteria)]|uniref:metal ABC transporter ATP-binding protein n=1 Tax=Gordonia sp. (in: high G+C Gram-positive bacteria) TaxID=84139 RepID=UPI0039E48EAD